MKTLPLNLMDLTPKETSFSLSTRPGETFTLCRWSLRVREWVLKKYTAEEFNLILTQMRVSEIADIVWFMLKDADKKKFADSRDEFLDSITGLSDNLSISKALMGTVGIGEPEFKKIEEDLAKKAAEESPTPAADEIPK